MIYCDPLPAYDSAVTAQEEKVAASKKRDLQTLLSSGETWSIGGRCFGREELALASEAEGRRRNWMPGFGPRPPDGLDPAVSDRKARSPRQPAIVHPERLSLWRHVGGSSRPTREGTCAA